MKYKIKDIGFAGEGIERIEWASRHMPVLKKLEIEYKDLKPFKGKKIAACLHVTTETAN